MKRDFDLIRLVLKEVEDSKPMEVYSDFQFEGYDSATINEHIELLIEAGLLAGKVARTRGRGIASVTHLTWAGHDFLQSLRDDTIWKKAKEQVLKPGASWTFDILKEWAKHELKQRLGLPE